MEKKTKTRDEIEAAELEDWRFLGDALLTRFRTRNFATGLRLVNLIGEAAEDANHHPDLDLRYPHLNVRLFSHDAYGVTDRDIELARRISELAASLDVAAEPASVSALMVALDTPALDRIKPFWRAALGYKDHPRAGDQMIDDAADLPPLWFQESGSEEPRQRFHFDLLVPAEVAKERIAAIVAAGGRVVGGEDTFTVLADAEGNKVCLCV